MRSFFTYSIRLFFILLFLIGLFIGLLPTLTSTDWGRKQAVYWINRSIPGKIEVKNLDLNWGKGQKIEGIILKDPEGSPVLEIEKFSTEASLWQLINKSTHLGFTQIQNLNGSIITDDRGMTNVQRALGLSSGTDSSVLPPSKIVLSDVNGDFYLFARQHPISAKITGLTKQGNLSGSFDLHLSLPDLHSSNWDEFKHDAENYLSIEGSKEAQLEVKVVNFPVDLIDDVISLKNPKLNGIFHSLLGDQLNLNIAKESSQEGLAFYLTANAPSMKGDIKGKIVNGIINLDQKGNFEFNLAPSLVNPFVQHHFELLKASQLNVIISELSLPLSILDSEKHTDPCQFGFQAELVIPETEISLPDIGKLSIADLHALLNSALCDKTIQFQLNGNATQGQKKEPFNLHLNSTIRKPENVSDFLKQLNQQLQISLKVSHLPLNLLPSLREHPEWIAQIGSHADAQLNLTSKNGKEWETNLSFQTSRIDLKEARFHIGKEIALASPMQINWKGTTDCLSNLLNHEELILGKPCDLNINIKQFQVPLDHLNLAKYQIELSIPSLEFPNLTQMGNFDVQKLDLKINGENLNRMNVLLTSQLTLLDQKGLNSPLLQTPLQMTVASIWEMHPDGLFAMSSGRFELNNSLANIRIEGRLTQNHDLVISKPAKIQYLLTPIAWKTLSEYAKNELPQLQNETPIVLTIQPNTFHLKSFSTPQLQVQGKLEINHLVFKDHSGELPHIKDLVFSWIVDSPNNNFQSDLNGNVFSNENTKPSQLSAHFQIWPTIGHYDASHTKAEAQINFAGIPSSVISMLFNLQDLSPMIGPLTDLYLKAFYDPANEHPGYLDLNLDSALFHAGGRFKLKENVTLFDSSKPPMIHLEVTPQSYQYLQKYLDFQNNLKLNSPFMITGNLSQLQISLKGGLDQGKVDVQLSTTDIAWTDSLTPSINVKGQVSSQNLKEDIQFSLKALSSSPSLVLQGNLKNVLDNQNKVRAWEEMGIKAQIQGQKLTPLLIQRLIFLDTEQTQKLKALLGDVFDIDGTCQLQNLNGPVQASVTGTQGQIHFDASIKEGILRLNAPLEGSVKMSPLFTEAFLSKNVPLLSSAVGADNPIAFRIDPAGFACPIAPFQLNQVKIGKGSLDLGKIQFRNEGELHTFLNIIQPISEPQVYIWFTPLYFNLDKSILTFSRLDMLIAHKYTLASWGQLNLNDHQGELIAGLTAQTLYYAFGIKGLSENYILQIPIHSETGKVEIDKKKAAARISSLAAQSHGGSKGKLIGSIVDLALSKGEEHSPSPTTKPFPWINEFHSTIPKESENSKSLDSSELSDQDHKHPKDKSKKKKKRHKESNPENPIKSLQDDAGQMIDLIFGK